MPVVDAQAHAKTELQKGTDPAQSQISAAKSGGGGSQLRSGSTRVGGAPPTNGR